MGLSIRLAMIGGKSEARAMQDAENPPAVLVSYAYLDHFLKLRGGIKYRDWVLDCGAFTAFAAGTKVPLATYMALCKKLIQFDSRLAEIYALDVITDWKSTLENTEKMWAAGIPAIPCYHIGEPEHMLTTIARTYPKIALGGMAIMNDKAKRAWVEACFARVWPKKVHGFGIGSDNIVLNVPFHSVDASSWALQPRAFGHYKMWGYHIPVRGEKHMNIRSNVDFYLTMERRANERWAKEYAELERITPTRTLAQQAAELKAGAHV